MASDHSKDASAGAPETRSLVGLLKQLTAIVAAVTALVAGVTALVVAGKAGWSEVGPYFSNLVRHGEVTIPQQPAAPKAVAPRIDAASVSALEDNAHAKRDAARRALAVSIAGASPESVDALVDHLRKSRSYRTQLGIAVALQAAPGGWPSANSERAVAQLRAVRDGTKDPTLRSALDGAARAARR